MKEHIISSLLEAQQMLAAFLTNEQSITALEAAAQQCITAFTSGNKVITCGNGGSMSDAMHFAEELTGRFRLNRRALPAFAISDPGHLSCCANDFGYEKVFSRMIEAHGQQGDVLVGISTSGKSPNVLEAFRVAQQKKLVTISLTGRPDSELGKMADIDICASGGTYADRAQELHIKIIHILIELIERNLFPENYKNK